ncbi:MAG: IS66 family transposase [Candidatus Nanoarchaeia archaeon]
MKIHCKSDIRKKSKDELVDELFDKLVENEKLKEEKEKLEKELKKYKNPNTPSSSNKHLKPNTQGLRARSGARRGAPMGHPGTTRRRSPVVTEVIDTDQCPRCRGKNVEDDKVLKRNTEEIPRPVVPEEKTSEIHIKKCNDCGLKFVPAHNTTPLKGRFGINLMVMVIFIRFILRGVLRKTATFLDSGFAFKITPASVNAIIKRVADAAEKEYEELKSRIRNAEKVYVDETSFSVLGKNQWVWVFRTTSDILLVIRPSRGSNVLEEILGKDYAGVVICDCWRAYNFLSKTALIQRCWAHLLRKSGDLCNTVPGRHLHEKLLTLFEEIENFNTANPTDRQRLLKYKKMTAQLEKLTTYYSRYEHLTKVVKYVNFNLENWFTCIKVAGIEPTNNFAEQAIRETVMVRKIIGAFRSETGKQNYETLASLIATWQLSGLDLKTQLRQMLVKNLCFC